MKSEAYYQHQNPKENRKEKQLEITEPMEIETEPQSVEEKYRSSDDDYCRGNK